MIVQEPEHPWLVAIRRRQRWLVVMAIVGVVVPLALDFVIFRLLSGMPVPGVLKWLWVGGVSVLGIVLIAAWMQLRLVRRWVEQMIASDGLLCPRCRRVLAIGQGSAMVACSQCSHEFQVEDVRQYWAKIAQQPMGGMVWFVQHFGPQGMRSGVAKLVMSNQRQLSRRIVSIIVGNLLLWTCFGVVMSLVFGKSLLGGMFDVVSYMFLTTGSMLASVGFRFKVGKSRHCSRCNYEQGPGCELMERCPECGLKWNVVGGIVQGRISRNKALIAIGAIMMMLSFASMYKPPMKSNWQLKLLPTGLLINQTVSAKGFTMSEWAELRTRTLSDDLVRQLAEGLLAKRRGLSLPWFTMDEDNWFAGMITAGKLPQDLKVRYYRDMLDIWIEAPTQAKVGQEVEVKLKFTFRGASSTNPTADACIGGFLIGEDQSPMARQEFAIAGILLDEKRSPSARKIECRFVPEKAGEIRIKAPVWVNYMTPGTGNRQLVWDSNGKPVAPPASVWQEERVIEHVIHVTE